MVIGRETRRVSHVERTVCSTRLEAEMLPEMRRVECSSRWFDQQTEMFATGGPASIVADWPRRRSSDCISGVLVADAEKGKGFGLTGNGV